MSQWITVSKWASQNGAKMECMLFRASVFSLPSLGNPWDVCREEDLFLLKSNIKQAAFYAMCSQSARKIISQLYIASSAKAPPLE